MKTVKIGGRKVGPGNPVYIIGEIGINHNGDVAIAKMCIKVAHKAGCDAVKFQKRTPELCVPEDQKNLVRETPWGIMTYMQYRQKVEFGEKEYTGIDATCRDLGIDWFASPWDIPSVGFMEKFNPVCHKVPSALLTDIELLKTIKQTGRPVMLSTGMSTMDEIDRAVETLGTARLLIAHTVSSYPCKIEELNLKMIRTLAERYDVPTGYSGHETGLQTTVAAVAMGACFVERHITLDRAMWGSDQAASVEPRGLEILVRDIRAVEKAMGNGVKRIHDSEMASRKRLRKN